MFPVARTLDLRNRFWKFESGEEKTAIFQYDRGLRKRHITGSFVFLIRRRIASLVEGVVEAKATALYVHEGGEACENSCTDLITQMCSYGTRSTMHQP